MDEQEKPKVVLENLFLHSKPVRMLLSLKAEDEKYTTQVSKDVDCTYSHTVKVLENFKKLGLVEFDKKGRIKIVKLTQDGEDIAHDFEGIVRKFGKVGALVRETMEIEPAPKEKKSRK